MTRNIRTRTRDHICFFCSVNVLCDPKEITMDVSFGLFLWKEIQIDIQDAASGQCDCVFRPLALSREFPTRQDSQWLPSWQPWRQAHLL